MSAQDTTGKKAKPGAAAKVPAPFDYKIPSNHRWASLWKTFAGVGVVGLGLGGVGYVSDPKRFAFSYLFAFICALTVGLGALFFIIVERLTSAGWSVTVRRIAEFFASGFPALAVLFLPVLLCMGSLFPWLHEGGEAKGEQHEQSSLSLITPAHAQEHVPGAASGHARPAPRGAPGSAGAEPGAAHRPPAGAEAREGTPTEAHEEETMAKKAGYLNKTFFLTRIVFYFGIWLFLAFRFGALSVAQDKTRDPSFTVKAQSFAPVATILFALSLTFAAFDWLMSLEPSWFSTIFGVTFFAGCVVTIFATVTVVAMSLREEGLVKDAITVEHFHDLGKLLFGFLVFWAYTNFSQFMLIWYAALPEETTFYHHRWDVGPWAYVSLLIVVAYFIVPFFILLSRNVKRRLPALRIGAVWLLVMHVVEVYWLVMPNYNGGESTVSWIDGACLIGVVGTYLALVFYNMTRNPLIPVGDPRLTRSLSFENA